LQQENNLLHNEIAKKDKELELLKEKIEELEYIVRDRDIEIEALEEENNGIRDDLDNANREKDEGYLEIRSLEVQVEDLKTELRFFIGYQE
jgi:SMC interacting uncharacterized protein involved in chromosome segregation